THRGVCLCHKVADWRARLRPSPAEQLYFLAFFRPPFFLAALRFLVLRAAPLAAALRTVRFFLFPVIGMLNDSFGCPGVATRAPQNANNMRKLRGELQYVGESRFGRRSHECHKTLILSVFLTFVRSRTILLQKQAPDCQQLANCTNHPSSGNPSRAFKTAFAACGFAFPPVAFIT